MNAPLKTYLVHIVFLPARDSGCETRAVAATAEEAIELATRQVAREIGAIWALEAVAVTEV